MRWISAAAALTFMGLPGGPSAAVEHPQGAPRLADERVLLRTNRGDLVIALYPDVAPVHVAQFLKLVRLGVYDSTWFFRIEPQFVAQLSTAQSRRFPLTPEQQAAIRKLPGEFSGVPHRPGVVSMARYEADPDSAETSFSFLLARAPHLDGKYTVFGELEWGTAVLVAIAMTPRDAQHRPFRDVLVEKALVKTQAEIARMRAAGDLEQAVPLPAGARLGEPYAPDAVDHAVTAGIALMTVLSLVGFLISGRIQPHRAAAFNLLTVLTGAFFLIRESAQLARDNTLIATCVFFGMVTLFKLMNRFEGARPNAPPTTPAPPAPAA
jgi:cyclophilin family peptidyl-prolyl cis-trans isomerase